MAEAEMKTMKVLERSQTAIYVVTIAITLAISIQSALSLDQIQFLHQGCYKDEIGQPDLPYQVIQEFYDWVIDYSTFPTFCASFYNIKFQKYGGFKVQTFAIG